MTHTTRQRDSQSERTRCAFDSDSAGFYVLLNSFFLLSNSSCNCKGKGRQRGERERTIREKEGEWQGGDPYWVVTRWMDGLSDIGPLVLKKSLAFCPCCCCCCRVQPIRLGLAVSEIHNFSSCAVGCSLFVHGFVVVVVDVDVDVDVTVIVCA